MNWLARLLQRDPPQPAPAAPAQPSADEHVRSGNALLGQGRLDDAAGQYRAAIHADARHADAHVNLGFALVELGRFKDATPPLREAVVLAPVSADAHYLLGKALLGQHVSAAAAEHLERAIALKPDLVVAYRDLGQALHEAGEHARAKGALRAGIAVDPAFADLHYFLGNIELQQMELEEALASYRRALAIDPGYAAVYSNMAPALLNLCDFAGAADAARQAVALDPQSHTALSNLLMTLSCDARCSGAQYLAEARRYGALVMARAGTPVAAASTAPAEPERRLRVGFVSGDLHSHPVGYFLESVLAAWDGADMDTVAYSNHAFQDALTARLQARFGAWRDVWDQDDDALARQVRADGIDVLIDLSGHTAENRLPLFARRPAAVQVSWLGYWASTGVPTLDYVLADPVSMPPAQRGHFSESVWYLPDTRLCFAAPSGDDVPAVSAPPALQAGHITFGSFQRLTKLNDEVLRLWARVLAAVPGAQLRLQSTQMNNAGARAQLLARLGAAGIDTARVRLVPAGTRIEYLAAHAEVDILLDTFPYSGATTTCEALWMGVPTVTLAGTTMLARQGASLLGCAGLADWIAADEDDYVARALHHASDVHALAQLRTRLRPQVAASALFDAARFAQRLQQAVRGMWREKACGQPPDLARSSR